MTANPILQFLKPFAWLAGAAFMIGFGCVLALSVPGWPTPHGAEVGRALAVGSQPAPAIAHLGKSI